MPIDKSWTSIKNRLSVEFRNGLEGFIEYAKAYANSAGLISCPCKKCMNHKMHKPDIVYAHIHDKGFDATYKVWSFHGEKYPSVRKESSVVPESINEMADIVNDFLGTSIVNDQVDDTRVDVEDEVDSNVVELLSKLQEELYPGCTESSSLLFTAELMHIKALYKWPNESVDMLLKLLKKILPKGSNLPSSFYEAKKMLSKLGLGYEMIHACENDCALFWKENADLQACPTCATSRWKKTKGKNVPRKVLRYFPLKDRLRRLYASRHTAKEMIWHQNGRSRDEDIMRHPVDGKAWKEFDKNYPDFASEPRNVRLALAADGFNPFGNMSTSYSMWPVVTTILNLPPWLCMKDPYKQLTLLIPGPNSPGKDIDVYLRPLVDELKELWMDGVRVHDSVSNTNFTMRAAVLMTINDFPARSSLSGWSGQGYMACPECNDETPSKRITSKICYLGHRRWLPLNHPLRKNKKIDGTVENRPPPRPKTTEQILEQLRHVQESIPGKHVHFGGKKRKRSPAELNWSKKSIFWSLPYWSSLRLRHNLDVMHIEKNVCDSLLGTLLNIGGKSKDTDKARIDLANMGVRKELHLYKEGARWMKPHAAYTLTPENQRCFYEFLKNVQFPDGFASNLSKNVGKEKDKLTGPKSHDCHVLLQRLIPTGIRPFLKKEIVDTIIEFSNFFKLMCSRTLRVSDMTKAERDIIEILCKLETIFPPAFFDIMVHLVMHLPDEAIRGGPIYLRWMYPIERFLGTLKQYIGNRARPEGSIAEAYIINETLTFCSMYFADIDTKFNRPERNWVEEDAAITSKISVFQNRFRPIGKMSVTNLDHALRSKAEYYVLQNCQEIQPHFTAHRDEIARSNPSRILDEIQVREFPKWFRQKILSVSETNAADVSDQLRALALGSKPSINSYPGCVINGVRFMVDKRDVNKTTQNSGVYVKGLGNQGYYGILEEIYELTYQFNNMVVLFKCKWFDTNPSKKNVQEYKNMISICTKNTWYENEPFILASQAEQVFYADDLYHGEHWKVVEHFRHRHIWDSVELEEDDVLLVEDSITPAFHLFVDLPNIDSMELGESSIPSNVVDSDVEAYLKGKSHSTDEFIDDLDMTGEEYDEFEDEDEDELDIDIDNDIHDVDSIERDNE